MNILHVTRNCCLPSYFWLLLSFRYMVMTDIIFVNKQTMATARILQVLTTWGDIISNQFENMYLMISLPVTMLHCSHIHLTSKYHYFMAPSISSYSHKFLKINHLYTLSIFMLVLCEKRSGIWHGSSSFHSVWKRSQSTISYYYIGAICWEWEMWVIFHICHCIIVLFQEF